MKHNFKAVFVAMLAVGLTACSSEEADNAPSGEVVSDSQTIETTTVDGIQYSAANYENGISYGDLSMGDPNAPITMIEYASLTCGHCANFHNNVLPEIEENYIKTGKVRLVYRNFLLSQPDLYASMIARCAPAEKSFAMLKLFFSRQSTWLNQDYANQLASLARRAGMSRATVDACTSNAELQKNLIEMQAYGSEVDNVTGTPTFIINGEHLTGVNRDALIETLEGML